MGVPGRANHLPAKKGPANLSKLILEFFKPAIILSPEALLFTFKDENHSSIDTEYWSADKHLVPRSPGTWLFFTGFQIQVRHLFLSHSATDILCFCHYSPAWLKQSESIAFATLGLVVSTDQIHYLKSLFLNAKVHTVFDDGIIGRVTDCKIALWMKGKDAEFKLTGDCMLVLYNKKRFSIPLEEFSLSRFEKTVSLRSGIRTHKPKEGFNSYHDFFVCSE